MQATRGTMEGIGRKGASISCQEARIARKRNSADTRRVLSVEPRGDMRDSAGAQCVLRLKAWQAESAIALRKPKLQIQRGFDET